MTYPNIQEKVNDFLMNRLSKIFIINKTFFYELIFKYNFYLN